jgi:hypothetical protein
MVGYGPLSLCVINKEGLCPSIEDINGLMIIKKYKVGATNIRWGFF